MTAPKRRWFQFGLREMLVLVGLLAVVSWQAVTMPTRQSIGFGAGTAHEFDGPPSVLVVSLRIAVWGFVAIVVWGVAIVVWRWGNRGSPKT